MNCLSCFQMIPVTLPAVGFSYAKLEKPLRATVYFSIEHARVRQAPCDAFDANFILSINFSLEVFVQKNANFSPKALTKERSKPSSKYSIYLVCDLNYKA